MQAYDETFDVVVVGFGFAGGATAIAAADRGARVLLLEKMPEPGGISICSAGGVRTTSSAKDALVYLRATNAGTAPDDLLRVLAEGMRTVGGFIEQLAAASGAKVSHVQADANYPFEGFRSFGFATIADVPGFDPRRDFPHVRGLRGGARLFKVVLDNVATRAIEVRLSCRALELVRGPAGDVEGLVVEKGGSPRRIRASGGVVLACGGFEAARDMQIQYWQEKPVLPSAYLGNTGDGIRMAQAVGADLWHMWHYHGSYGLRHVDPRYPYGIRPTRFRDWTPGAALDPEGEIPAFFTAAQDMRMPWIVVDQTGRRYMNEYPPYVTDTGHRPMIHFDPGTQTYPRIPSYLVTDGPAFERHALGFPTYNDPGVDFEWSPDNRRELELGIIKRADSLEALAALIGAEVARLRETIERWNRLCQQSRDEDHGRESWSMAVLSGPPFYAAEVWPTVANTQGGPIHDSRQRVLNAHGTPIGGLFAAGEIGSVFGHLYLSGGNLAECFIGGRIAGAEAAARARTAPPCAE
ncbi:MAG: FAD-dependent oxidoreductase [Betaproteobacteria bacterium]|nr:FAD-dependent oxidoreductase [Betaproteobacteria bacterium]